jgi:hypothetical protein
VRCPPPAAGELADAVEPGDQGLGVEGHRERWRIKGWFRHLAMIEQLWTRRKRASPGRSDSNRLETAAPRPDVLVVEPRAYQATAVGASQGRLGRVEPISVGRQRSP